jgi:hypothetical protein
MASLMHESSYVGNLQPYFGVYLIKCENFDSTARCSKRQGRPEMPTIYMVFWSIIMIIALGLGRVRNVGQTIVMILVTALVLVLSQSLYIQLSISAGLEPSSILYSSREFLMSGPLGWLALLVMPCGWLGPIVGWSTVRRWFGTAEIIA